MQQPKHAKLVASGAHLIGAAKRFMAGGHLAPDAEDLLLQSCSVFDDVAKALTTAAAAPSQPGAALICVDPGLVTCMAHC